MQIISYMPQEGGTGLLQEFTSDLDDLYADIMNKRCDRINSIMDKWNRQKKLGDIYQELSRKEDRKQTGSFYTPEPVVAFMTDQIKKYIDYSQNPYIRILDPSCGGGDFLVAVYHILYEMAVKAGIRNPSEHVVKNNIFGFDTDKNAVKIASIELYKCSGVLTDKIRQSDFLTQDCGIYDIIIGNPPYMGHKVLTGEYRNNLYELYGQVFSDKSDIAYCFVKKAVDSLKKGGSLSFFISRYMLEALNGKSIREYIIHSGRLQRIVDFYGIRLVKGAGVDNIILEFQKLPGSESCFEYVRLKPSARNAADGFGIINNDRSSEYVKRIYVNQNRLNDSGWVFTSSIEQSVIDKIKGVELGTLCESYQGIITGCDEAFVLKSESIKDEAIEEEILFQWLKNSDISPFHIRQSRYRIIYSDLITDEEKYKNAIRFISRKRDRLELRRECQKGLRKWYQLQWGRNLELFTGKKIIYPYKASSNRFAIDNGSFFSADIYALKIRDMFLERTSYEFLVGVLNSSIYEFYIKSMAKKLGEDLYEYYPNKIINIKIPHFIKAVEEEVLKNDKNIRYNIDMILLNYFGMTLDEYAVVRSWCI